MNNVKALEFIICGNVQKVGYRDFVAKIGQELKIDGTVENQPDGSVKIRCMGDEQTLNEFKYKITLKNPKEALLVSVEDIKCNQIDENCIEKGFHEIYNDSKQEMAQRFSTGMNYMNLFRTETSDKFNTLNEKYHVIPISMGKIIEQWEK